MLVSACQYSSFILVQNPMQRSKVFPVANNSLHGCITPIVSAPFVFINSVSSLYLHTMPDEFFGCFSKAVI